MADTGKKLVESPEFAEELRKSLAESRCRSLETLDGLSFRGSCGRSVNFPSAPANPAADTANLGLRGADNGDQLFRLHGLGEDVEVMAVLPCLLQQIHRSGLARK
jgi:hypothetical protein